MSSASTSFRNPLKAALDARKAIAALESSSIPIFQSFRGLDDPHNYLQFRLRMDDPHDPFQIVGNPSTKPTDLRFCTCQIHLDFCKCKIFKILRFKDFGFCMCKILKFFKIQRFSFCIY